jgi:hypothetical protein
MSLLQKKEIELHYLITVYKGHYKLIIRYASNSETCYVAYFSACNQIKESQSQHFFCCKEISKQKQK